MNFLKLEEHQDLGTKKLLVGTTQNLDLTSKSKKSIGFQILTELGEAKRRQTTYVNYFHEHRTRPYFTKSTPKNK